ncbi:hypothetical protein ACS0TY_028947 [Phlomoides rotata]
MTSLKLRRSSYSFRRQGSSGRIWDNVVDIPETVPSSASSSANVSMELNYHPISSNNSTASPSESIVVVPSHPPPRSKSKGHSTSVHSVGYHISARAVEQKADILELRH